MAFRELDRLAYRRKVRLDKVPLQQRYRSKTQLARAEDQPTAVRLHRGLFQIFAGLKLLTLDHDLGLQRLDEFSGRLVKTDREIDHADRAHIFDAQVLRKRDAGDLVGIDPNDKEVCLLG